MFQKSRRYWLEKYSETPRPLLIPRYSSQYNSRPISNGRESLYLPRAFYKELEKFSQTHQVSFFHTLIGILYVYFTNTMERNDFTIGLPLLNRSSAQFKKTAGLFMSVSPVWFNMGRKLTFIELIQAIKRTLKQHYRHQRFPTSELNKAINLEQHRTQLFDVTFSYENQNYNTQFNNIESYFTELLHPWKKIELMISARGFQTSEDISFNFIYNQEYFNVSEIQALQTQFIY